MEILYSYSLFLAAGGGIFSSYNLIIASSLILIVSFFFGEFAKKTNIPSVLMLIVLGMILKVILDSVSKTKIDFSNYLEILGIIGLIMIVLEAALELKLERDKYIPIAKALGIAFIGLMACTWVAALILHEFIPEMTMQKAWIYGTTISILSSAIIIPSVTRLTPKKKEFHIYESTFSDILGIMLFYFLVAPFENGGQESDLLQFGGTLLATIVMSLIASYLILIIFQRIQTHVKLFLLIAVLLLLYAVGKKMHLSSLIIILIFGLLISNIKLFFRGTMAQFLDKKQAHDIYEGLHVLTMESAFVVRTFFFVVFGLTISVASLANLKVALISLLILASIYIIRFVILRMFIRERHFPSIVYRPKRIDYCIAILCYSTGSSGRRV